MEMESDVLVRHVQKLQNQKLHNQKPKAERDEVEMERILAMGDLPEVFTLGALVHCWATPKVSLRSIFLWSSLIGILSSSRNCATFFFFYGVEVHSLTSFLFLILLKSWT